MNKRANYEIVQDECTDEELVIRDIGPWNEYLTVTNAAEQVIEELFHDGRLTSLTGWRQVFYYDSDGNRDEIVHERGVFKGFKPAR
jgi:hypothetical protein